MLRLVGIGVCLLALSLLALSGCGGGSSFVDGTYSDPEARYRVGELGEGWARIGVSQNDLAWHNESLGAIVQVNASCDPYRDVPLTSLTNHLLIGFTDREWRSSDRVPLDGREALRSHIVASLDGVPRELLLYVLKKDGCTYDFALIAPPGSPYSEAERLFEPFVGDFSTDLTEP